MILVELDPQMVQESPAFPDKDVRIIYEHLKAFFALSKIESLPVLRVCLQDNSAVVVAGHKYLRLARDLQYSKIRCIVDARTPETAVQIFVSTNGRLLDKAILQEEPPSLEQEWHVFFFEHPLSAEQKRFFEKTMNEGFDRSSSQLFQGRNVTNAISSFAYESDGISASFRAWTPIGDHQWARYFMTKWGELKKNGIAVISHNGTKMPVIGLT